MARIRTIKPSFFLDDEISELKFSIRLLFIGLWTLADREGRLLYKPKRIKAAIFPYDNIDIVSALDQLQNAGFIVCYDFENEYNTTAKAIQILSFKKHQIPNVREPQSTIPAPYRHSTGTVQEHVKTCAGTLGREGKGTGTGKEGGNAGAPAHDTPEIFNPDFSEIQEALTGEIFMQGICSSRSWPISEFENFVRLWLDDKKTTGDFQYPIRRLKTFVVLDFEKSKKNKKTTGFDAVISKLDHNQSELEKALEILHSENS